MKNLLYLFPLLFLATACNSVLDRAPQESYTLDNYFLDAEQATQSVNAIYSQLRDWETHVFSFIGMTDIVSDDSNKGSTPNDAFFLQEVDDFAHTPTNVAPASVWNGYYVGIFRANLAIDRIPTVPEMDENLRMRLIGEAKFLRAHFYFNLVRWFGDLPLITEPFPSDFSIERSPKSLVYEQIIADLNDASDALPTRNGYTSADVGRATQGAAKAMLAKVYLTLENWPEAERLALEVINSGQYNLYNSYAKLFRREGENSVESIFEVQAAAYETGGGGTQYNEVQGVRGEPNLGWGFNSPSNDLLNAYEPGDPRRDATILFVGEVLPDGSGIVQDNVNIIGERYNQKAWVPEHTGGNGNGPGNIRILRYADVLLIAAEALNENGKTPMALTYINLVRERARGTSPSVLPNLTLTDPAELRAAIWRERRVELALEQHRWFDLVRQKRAATVMQNVGKNFIVNQHELFPIPQGEIDLSQGALVQNPGYN
ncbi:RagB/SusD family nutrient uptake outer membrane protein [Lewinella sp. LCG006]|uniref:RagB/SusD family nutrient uptake outer membrane protein n=1 Tax=Lewinella sp. LCG006 TaxID=3231911 RepID=UPI00345F84AF